MKASSPLVAWDVEVPTQGSPHLTRIGAVLDGLGRSASAHTRQDVVDEHRRSPRRAELAFDKHSEFREPHRPKLRRRTYRFMAHPYRICDLRDAGPGPDRGFPITR